MKKLHSSYLLLLILSFGLIVGCGKDKDSDDNPNPNPTSPTDKVLVITKSSVTISEGETFALSANFVSQTGAVTSATGISWTISDATLASITSAGVIKGLKEGAGFAIATVTQSTGTYVSKIPFVIKKAPAQSGGAVSPPNYTGLVVAPAAILWGDADPNDKLQLEYVYFGTGTLSAPAFSSSNAAVADVSSAGLVTFKTAGEAIITVSASAGGNNYVQRIPVVVFGIPAVPLPVSRVEITPGFSKSFLDKTIQYSVRAFNGSGVEVTGLPVVWEIEDPEPDTLDNGQLELAATVNSSGLVTTKAPRQVKVKATISGITGTADLLIYPDGYYSLSPIFFNMSPIGNQLITATYFEFDANFNPQQKPLPAGTSWLVLNDLIPFGAWPVKGNLAGSGNTRTYSIDQFSSITPGSDFILVLSSNEKIMPGVSTAFIQ